MSWSTSNEIWCKSICVWTTSWFFGFKPVLVIQFVNVGGNHVDKGVTAILETDMIIFWVLNPPFQPRRRGGGGG